MKLLLMLSDIVYVHCTRSNGYSRITFSGQIYPNEIRTEMKEKMKNIYYYVYTKIISCIRGLCCLRIISEMQNCNKKLYAIVNFIILFHYGFFSG